VDTDVHVDLKIFEKQAAAIREVRVLDKGKSHWIVDYVFKSKKSEGQGSLSVSSSTHGASNR
jgi:hypothetical protein